MTKHEIDQQYLAEATQLESAFFDVINPALPDQHRVLKDGKDIEEFNQLHTEIWLAHDAALIAAGYRDPPPPEPPPNPDVVRLQEIIATSPAAITMPEIWEAIRILARLIT